MPLTFAERQEIARKAVEAHKARKNSRPPRAKRKPLSSRKTYEAPQASPMAGEDSEIVEEAVQHGRLSADERKALIAYQRLADLPPGTVVRHFDSGWRSATLVEVGRTRTSLRTIPNYKGRSQEIVVMTVDIKPVEGKL